MPRPWIMPLVSWTQDSCARRQVALGGAVLLLSSIVVGIVHIASTTPEVLTNLRLYVNPDSARVCALARCGFTSCIVAIGVLGFTTCIFFSWRRLKALEKAKGEAADKAVDFKLNLSEASHWSCAIHASVLVFVCILGILSRPVACDPEPGIVIELTPVQSMTSVNPSAGGGQAKSPRRVADSQTAIAKGESSKRAKGFSKELKLTISPAQKRSKERVAGRTKQSTSAHESRVSRRGAVSRAVAQAAIPPPCTSVLSGTGYIPEPAFCVIESPQAAAPDPESGEETSTSEGSLDVYQQWTIGPAAPRKQDNEVSICFEKSNYVTTFFRFGDAFGVVCKNSVRDEGYGELLSEATQLDPSQVKFAVWEPDMVHYPSDHCGGLPVLARRRAGNAVLAVPPSPHYVRRTIELNDVVSNPHIARQVPLYPDIITQGKVDYSSYMTELRKAVIAKWHPVGSSQKPTIVYFQVAQNGSLKLVELESSSGNAEANQAGLKAVRDTAPFAQLPAGAPEFVEIAFTFHPPVSRRKEHINENKGAYDKVDRFYSSAKPNNPK